MDLNNIHAGSKLIKQVLEQKRPVKKQPANVKTEKDKTNIQKD